MNKQRRASISAIRSELEDLQSRIEDLQNEEQEAYDNLPESFQMGEKGEASDVAIGALEMAAYSIAEALASLEEAEA